MTGIATFSRIAHDHRRQHRQGNRDNGLDPDYACPFTLADAIDVAALHDLAILHAALVGNRAAAEALDDTLQDSLTRHEWGHDGLAAYYDARRETDQIVRSALLTQAALTAIQDFAIAARRHTERGRVA